MSTSEHLSRRRVRGYAGAVAVLACFAVAWTGWGLSVDLAAPISYSIIAVAGLGFLVLLGGAIELYRHAKPGTSDQDTAGRANGIGRRFGAIAAAEIIGLVIVSRVVWATGNDRFAAAAFCLMVGLHFFPLRRLFHAPIYNVTAAVLTVLALATVPLAILTGQVALWTALPAFGAALTLFTTGALLPNAQRPLRREPATPPRVVG